MLLQVFDSSDAADDANVSVTYGSGGIWGSFQDVADHVYVEDSPVGWSASTSLKAYIDGTVSTGSATGAVCQQSDTHVVLHVGSTHSGSISIVPTSSSQGRYPDSECDL